MIIQMKDIGMSYKIKSGYAKVLHSINLTIDQAEFVAITGPSGAGKSTLLNLLALLERPTEGLFYFLEQPVSSLSGYKLASIRNKNIGFVFQDYELVNDLTVYDNVELPLVYAGRPRRHRRSEVTKILSDLGLEQHLQLMPVQLSGGQQQRVALARAIINRPALLICDEPTGNLDSRTAETILSLLEDLHRQGCTIILVTHDMNVAAKAKRIITMENGMIISDKVIITQEVSK